MKTRFFFELKTLPDFTLTSYQAINMSDLDSVAQNNVVFLKQLHSLGVVLGMSFHLYYSYKPSLPTGSRIKIFLMCCTEDEKIECSGAVLKKIMSSFAASSCYKLESNYHIYRVKKKSKAIKTKTKEKLSGKHLYYRRTTPLLDYTDEYKCFNLISKKEYLTNPNFENEPPQNGLQYYSISEWTAKRNARMYNSLKLLGNYEAPTVIRIDIFPVDDSNAILDNISKTGVYSKIQSQAAFKAFGESGVGVAKRDEAASKVNSFYDNYYQTMSSSLQFEASICVLGNSELNCRLLGDVICSEILEKGMIEQKTESGLYKADYKLKPANVNKISIFDNDYNSNKVPEMATLFTIDEIAPFFSFPYLYPSENIGIRKETDPKLTNDGFRVGSDTNGYDVCLPWAAFAKHTYISGVPGSGKTYSMKHIVHSLSKEGIPFLVFEPAKREYRGLYDVSAGLTKKNKNENILPCEETKDIILLCPKTNTLFPLHINPFEVPAGVSVNDYISVLFDVFNGAFSWPQPTPMILKSAMFRAYKKCGFYGAEIITEEHQKKANFPTIDDLYDSFQWIMDNEFSYQGELQSNIKGVLETRIGSLREGNVGEIFNMGLSTFRPEEWNKFKIILELENLSNEHANFITLLIISLIRLDLKKNPSVDEVFPENDPRRKHNLRHVIFFEEAHNLIGKKSEETDSDNANSKIASTAFIKNMLAEVRAYKQGIVIADQLPTAIAPEVLKNTSVKIAHKQTATDEREAIGSVMSADSIQLEMLSKFEKGQGLITFEGVLKPFYFQVESEFEYKSDTREDVFLASQLDSTSDWFADILYEKSLYKKFDKAKQNAVPYCQNVENLLENNSEFVETLANCAVNNSYKEISDTYDILDIGRIGQRIKLYIEHSDKLLEAFHGMKYVFSVLVENKIPHETSHKDKIQKMSNDTSDFIKHIEHLAETLSELYGQITFVLKNSNTER